MTHVPYRSRFPFQHDVRRVVVVLLALAALVGLAGCAGPASTVRPQATPVLNVAHRLPPEIDKRLPVRQKMVAIALQEWQRWGGQQVRVGRDDSYCVIAPSSLAPALPIIPSPVGPADATSVAPDSADNEVLDDIEAIAQASTNGTPCLRFPDGTGAEASAMGCQLAQRYWAIVGRVPDCMQITTGRWAWSATFLSWLMRAAGLNERQFLTGASHAMYVVDARDGILPEPAFRVAPLPAMPRVGDMVCGGRGRDKYMNDIAEIRFGATPMHCDLVVEVDTTAHVVKAIGGNVQQSVSMSLIELGDSGQIDGVTNSTVPWLLVMRNQLPM
ncbi:DUF2272 domain-containing protein [Imbroritus primus]|uniref:DUF2272 domain-containing protein n=1 Tax=Imbroritus primus TaxID=3058603 RepID=A0ACD3SP36_9BURK|nr:DUF2272 domain-containing protein [Burkholderiaceae bacterium PBA]